MSAIFGFLNLDGRPAAREDLAAMDRTLAHCGPDGSVQWADGPVAMGHRMLHLTAEPPGERPPLESAGGDLVLAADAVLDKRDELLTRLGLKGAEERRLGDGELILRAWERWGENATEQLLGDFAFALWDRRRRQLFCARDHIGIRPLYTAYIAGKLFAFASEIKGLLALSRIPRRLDEMAAADFLTWNFADKERTFYDGVRRLAPGHALRLSPAGLERRCYWHLEPREILRLGSRQAYAEALREQIDQAVACRLRSSFRRASHLSGGLDSSALTVVAARQLRAQGERLLAVSFVPPGEGGAEFGGDWPWIEPVLCQEQDIEWHPIRIRDPHAEAQRREIAIDVEGPPSEGPAENHAAALMAALGARVVLSGWGGDELASFNGRGYYSQLLITGRWFSLWRESLKRCRNYDVSPHGFLVRHVLGFLLPDRLRPEGGWFEHWRRAAHPDFARRVGLDKGRRRGLSLGPSLRRNQIRLITYGHIQHRVEGLALIGGRTGVAYRFPLLDKRLLELCLAVPPDQYVHDGWTRYLFRRAMAGLLPEKVRWRSTKWVPRGENEQPPPPKAQLLELLAELERNPVAAGYLDFDWLQRQLESLPASWPGGRQIDRRSYLRAMMAVDHGLALAQFLVAVGLE